MRVLILTLLLAQSAAALAGQSINESRSSDADAHIRFNAVEGELKIVPNTSNRWELSGELSESVKSVDIRGDEHAWTIELKYRHNYRSHGSSQLTLSVPVEVTLNVEVVSTNLELGELQGGRLELQTVSGDITSHASPESLELQTVSGDIELLAAGRQFNKLESVSGDLTVSTSLGVLEAHTVSGEITVRQARLERAELESVSGDLYINVDLSPGGELSAASHSGDVEVLIPAGLGLQVDAESFSGNIKSAWGEVERRRHGPGSNLRHREGNGSTHIELHSFSGDIKLSKR